MPFGRKSPLEALALPGVMLAYKYSQFRQRRREAASRRVTERELSALHHKIDKLLSKLEESEPDPPTSQEDECVICINARATMQTSPCGHRVVCRRCFVKTIQSAVAQRLLPLRCVICRARVNRLTSSSGSWRIQESASSYSMGAKSWASASLDRGAGAGGAGVHTSASSYSMSDAHSGLSQVTFHAVAPAARHPPRSPNGRVAPSASLYSMSSASSSLSSASNATNFSKTSSISTSGLYSPGPASPIPSPSAASYTSSSASSHNHLAPPSVNGGSSQSSFASLSPVSAASLSPRDLYRHQQHQQQQQRQQRQQQSTHSHHAGCPSGCSGAIPRKPLQAMSSSSSSSSSSASSSGSCGRGGGGGGRTGETVDSEAGGVDGYGGASSLTIFASNTHTYPGRRFPKGRLMDLQNRLPPIKEFRSPAKVPHPSPVHISNPRFRYSSYTKSAKNPPAEMLPLLCEPPSPPRRPLNIHVSTSLTTLGPPPQKPSSGAGVGGGLSAKISPLTKKNALPRNAYTMPKDKKGYTNNNHSNNSIHINAGRAAGGGGGGGVAAPAADPAAAETTTNSKSHHNRTSASSRGFPLLSYNNNNNKEKADNKKNESMERKKKEEKLKLKAEKEARKEEKRLAKEEERLAKLIAKEEKKKNKQEAKELLIASDGNNRK